MTSRTLSWSGSEVLASRRWWSTRQPFLHFCATSVFTAGFYRELEDSVGRLLRRGFAENPESERLSRSVQGSDTLVWNLPPKTDGPLALFYSQEWHDMLARLCGVDATGDVSCAVHHHQTGSEHGRVHRDLGVGWFPGPPPGGAVNPADAAQCSYTHGDVKTPGLTVHEAVRAVTMICYVANPQWRLGDGGETGLYRHPTDQVARPEVGIPPVNNSILVFENTPWAFHAFVANTRTPRTSVVVWLHRPIDEARALFGERNLFRWRREYSFPPKTGSGQWKS